MKYVDNYMYIQEYAHQCPFIVCKLPRTDRFALQLESLG